MKLYELLLQCELYVGNEKESNDVMTTAKGILDQSPSAASSTYALDEVRQRILNNYQPQLPCPAQVTIAPAFRQNPSLTEAQLRVEPGRERALTEERSLIVPNGQMSELIDALKSIASHITAKPAADQTSPPIADQAGRLDEIAPRGEVPPIKVPPITVPPLDPPPQQKPRVEPKRFRVKIRNYTDFPIRPIVNGSLAPDEIPPGITVLLGVDFAPLTIARFDGGTQTQWQPENIFVKTNGTQATPIFYITGCCVELMMKE